ncbi:MAG TPA: FAD-dependent oxidoreductase [Holophagaceae bacterium]|nr:FAD-dependent oxidoreductase [Holophagaceae bacterium]
MDILIVGGGIAGLSTAFHLVRSGAASVMVVDREALPGFYASGHNAGIARQLTGRREHSALAIRGRARLAEAGLVSGSGGLLLAMEPGSLDALEAEAAELGVPVKRGPGAGLKGLNAAEHLAIPSDGVIDIHGMLGHCARGARAGGAHLRFGCDVEAIVPLEQGFEVQTSEGLVRARTLVNAAGAWARELGRRAGGLELALRPLRRHLVYCDVDMPQDNPWAWWVDRPLYLRPESGGLLLCPCDESEVALPPIGAQPEIDPEAVESLGPTLSALAPALVDAPLVRAWCGLRTFSPDRRFVLGWDPVNPDLFWVAGLGGHGMTTGLAVGELSAELILNHGEHELSPKRFAPA